MKNIKRILSLFLSAMMLVSTVVFPTSVFAKDEVEGVIEVDDISEKIKINANLKTVTTDTFGDFTYKILEDNTVEIFGYSGSDATVNVPSEINGQKVTGIGDVAFTQNETMEHINLPNTITRIGDHAFNECSNLIDIVLPDSVEVIADNAFTMCSSLKDVTLSKNLKTIGAQAFYQCSQMQRIKFPDGLTSIGAEAFYECSNLRSIAIPDSVTNLGDEVGGVFNSCYYLTDVVIGKGVTSIDEGLFMSCQALTNITLPNTITSIGYASFMDCGALNSIQLPNSLTSIGTEAFELCVNLENINIPDGVTSIEDSAFMGCTKLTSLIIPNSVTEIGYFVFEECGSQENPFIAYVCAGSAAEAYCNENEIQYTLFSGNIVYKLVENTINVIGYMGNESNVEVPSTIDNYPVIKISQGAFAGYKSLTSITIPSSVTEIEANAFDGCSSLKEIKIDNENPNYKAVNGVLFNKDATELIKCPEDKKGEYTIPSSVKTISDKAFFSCKSLTKVVIPKSVEKIGANVFSTGSLKIVLYRGSYAETYCKENNISYTPFVEKITLNAKSKNVIIGKKYQLKATKIEPIGASNALLWVTSNRKIATVSSTGNVTAKAVGKVTVSAKAADGSNVVAKATIKVIPATVSRVKIKAGKKKATLTISKTKGAKKYEIYRSTKKKTGFKKIATTKKTKYIDKKKLKSRRTYYYKVRAVNGIYKGNFSKVFKVKVK